jgi:hypothetical protein
MQEQLGCFICIPVCRDHIPRRYPDGHDEFFQNSDTRGGLAAHKRWKCGERATRDDRAGRRGVHRKVPFFLFYGPARSLNQW